MMVLSPYSSGTELTIIISNTALSSKDKKRDLSFISLRSLMILVRAVTAL